MFGCLKNIYIDKEYFSSVIEIFKQIGDRIVMKDP